MQSSTSSIDLADHEQLWRSIRGVTLDPIKNSVYSLFPLLSAMHSNFMPIRPLDLSQNGMIPPQAAATISEEVERLRKCARLSRQISLYTALNFHFMSYGGSLSLTKPVLSIPYQHLFRPNGSTFGQEKSEERLQNNLHAFTDDETRFFIAREIGHIKYNDALLKTAAKILLVAAVCLLWSMPLSWPAIAGIATLALSSYVLISRHYEGKIDLFAARVAGEAVGDRTRALRAAISALEKLRLQNLERREANWLTRLYIAKDGENALDLRYPLLSTRIAALQKALAAMS